MGLPLGVILHCNSRYQSEQRSKKEVPEEAPEAEEIANRVLETLNIPYIPGASILSDARVFFVIIRYMVNPVQNTFRLLFVYLFILLSLLAAVAYVFLGFIQFVLMRGRQ